jgi:DNA-binding transcriptional regulator YdaS (Cro superfamily)
MKKKTGPKMDLTRRDTGLMEAINAAGSARELARRLGMSSQSLLHWKRIPADRLLQIEEVTKVPRERLRPDLYRG